MRATSSLLLLCACAMGACSALPNRDPLSIDVAGIEPLQGEGLELRLSVRVRIQNPNDTDIEYSGAALNLDLNGRKLASGVSAVTGTVPRYGEAVLEIPVTISAFNMARQVLGFVNAKDDPQREVSYTVRGKLEGGVFGTRRFTDEGTFELPADRVAAKPL
ncbi:MAG TPA: LEA type 2 family protein [Gammaproteobacteria bacterium]